MSSRPARTINSDEDDAGAAALRALIREVQGRPSAAATPLPPYIAGLLGDFEERLQAAADREGLRARLSPLIRHVRTLRTGKDGAPAGPLSLFD
jgi:hypothetical protein